MASNRDKPKLVYVVVDAASAATSSDRFFVTKAKDSEATDKRNSKSSPNPAKKENGGVDEYVTENLLSETSSTQKIVSFSKMELYEEGEEDFSVQRYLEEQKYPGFGFDEGSEPKEKANLGVILGVFFPCIQNIFGVIYFVRLYWIVGEAGSVEAFFIVFSCCCVSILTSLSISAIATNGRVTGGGTYFMISRSLGPEFGGAVGILFYLGISVSVAMYLAGSIELLLEYITPELNISDNKYNNARLYGTLLLLIVSAAVFTGVKFVSRLALLVLSAVLVAILSVYIGMFVATPDKSIKVCFLGDRLLKSKDLMENGTLQCTKDPGAPLHRLMCGNASSCDPYFLRHRAHMEPAVPGLSASIFAANAYNSYGEEGELIGTQTSPKNEKAEITRDITTSFVVLLAIYFPSITGFEQGSSYSGDLEDAQKSIPMGTLWAVAVTSTVYLSTVLLFSATVHGSVLRDKFGASIGSHLVMSQLSWPSPWVILIGALMSTVGAGLQALTAAPRLLQAIAKDNVFPILHRFTYMTRKGEPMPAIALSVGIAEIGILIANLDYVAPIVTMFFLLCYGFVNFACALQSLLRSPHWRPRFRFYHWSLALLGMALCLTLMVLSSWYYTLIALFLATSAYKYVEYKGAEKEWGDGMRGLAMSAARYGLLRLKQDVFEGNTKNWRPQLLVLMKLNSALQPMQPRLLSLVSQMKAGGGLTIVSSVIPGDFYQLFDNSKDAKYNLLGAMEQEQVKGFANVVVSDSASHGLCHVIQSSGLGALYPNTVMVCWPDHWFDSQNRETYQAFMDTLHYSQAANLAMQVVKGAGMFPENSDRLEGTIDIWWIMHDGSMLIMLAFLLKQHKVWKNCSLRLFTVAQIEDNSVQIKNDLIQYMYNLRIPATVEVVEMEDQDISAYIYERTLKMEERTRLLNAMNLKRKESMKVVETVMDRAHRHNSCVPVTADPLVGQSGKLEVETERIRPSSLPFSDAVVQYTFSPEPAVRFNMSALPHVKDTFPEEQGEKDATEDTGKAKDREKKELQPLLGGPSDKTATPTTPTPAPTPTPASSSSNHPMQSTRDTSKSPASPEHVAVAMVADAERTSATSDAAFASSNNNARTSVAASKPPPKGEQPAAVPDSELLASIPDAELEAGIPKSKPKGMRGSVGRKASKGKGNRASKGEAVEGMPANGSDLNFSDEDGAGEEERRESNMRKMHTAVHLNQKLRERSENTELIIINLPSIPNHTYSQANYMHFLEVLVEGLDRVLMIRGTGREVITMYN